MPCVCKECVLESRESRLCLVFVLRAYRAVDGPTTTVGDFSGPLLYLFLDPDLALISARPDGSLHPPSRSGPPTGRPAPRHGSRLSGWWVLG